MNKAYEDLEMFDYAVIETPLGLKIRHVHEFYNKVPYEFGGYFGRRFIRKEEYIDGFRGYLTARDFLTTLQQERNIK